MTRRPMATVHVLKLPHLGPGAVRVEVECPASTTGITHLVGGAFQMDAPLLITMAVTEHEVRCEGNCDTSEAHAEGDQGARKQLEWMKDAMQTLQQRRSAQIRRN